MADSCNNGWGWDCYNNDWWWVWGLVFLFLFIMLLTLPWSYYRRADNCGEYLPPDRYNYRPSRVVVVEEDTAVV